MNIQKILAVVIIAPCLPGCEWLSRILETPQPPQSEEVEDIRLPEETIAPIAVPAAGGANEGRAAAPSAGAGAAVSPMVILAPAGAAVGAAATTSPEVKSPKPMTIPPEMARGLGLDDRSNNDIPDPPRAASSAVPPQ